jgi:cardiolipin synthase
VEEGVEVRVLYDSMGCRKMGKQQWDRIREKGIQVGEFFPAFFKRLHLRINYRNHRKIIIIDGTKAYVGGFNIGREYLGLDKRFGYWRDTHLRIRGSAAISLHVRFILDWNYATKQNLFQNANIVKEYAAGTGKVGVQIISSGPDTQNEEIRDNYQKLIGKARDHVYIQTPYLILDDSMVSALVLAAKNGVDVRILTPGVPDKEYVHITTRSYYKELIAGGVKIYEYSPGFIHAKVMVADDTVATVGTVNLDCRSLYLHFECAVYMYNNPVV